MKAQLRIFLALACLWGSLGNPQLLECANDTATRLRLGGRAIMAGPVKACGAQCPVSLAKKADENGNIQITVTTTDAVAFVVRVSDGAGVLSSSDANLAQTISCDRQMYSKGSTGIPAGAYVLTLTPKASSNLADLVVTVGWAKNFAPGVMLVRDPPLPPQNLYKCTKNQCLASDTGVDLSTCQQLCKGPAPGPSPPGPSPPPSPPGQLYKCQKNQCTSSATGVDLPTCQQLCKGPAPSPTPAPPPSPPGQMFKCIKNQCTSSSSGVDLPTCQQLCKGPSPPPTPPPPSPAGQMYKCENDQCTASSSGVDLPTCQQLCKGPAPGPSPPGPSPPGPWPPSCAGDSCPVCITDYVLGILASVADCLTLQLPKCVTTSLTCIENLVNMIQSCTKYEDSAAMHKLVQLLSASDDETMSKAAATLQRALQNATVGGFVV